MTGSAVVEDRPIAADAAAGPPLPATEDEVSIKKTMSMLEMNEIAQVRELEEAVQNLTTMEKACSKMKRQEEKKKEKLDDDSSGEDFFFYDEDERSQGSDGEEKTPISSDDSSASSSSTGMRRSQSLVTMPTPSSVKRPLRIDPIVEEIIHEDNETAEEAPEKNTPVKAFCPNRRPKRSSLKISSLKSSLSSCSLATVSSSGSLSDENGNGSMKRNVSFASLEIREYDVTLGDNPCVSCGPPLSLDWSYRECGSMCVEQYESLRVPRRSREDLILSYGVRRFRLIREAGFSMNDIKDATESVRRMQRRRKTTYSRLPTLKFEEALESAGRKMKRLVKGKA
mmetsp:Transcript_15124/g.20597  ORF Transcript_15124/g.20597 Transcript_15124/m.20597 type:complete len:340 (-) Transcript_15124:66-1085(-)